MKEHDWNLQDDFCRHCGAAAAEVEDGVRRECMTVATDDKGNPKPFRTHLMPGGRGLSKMFWPSP